MSTRTERAFKIIRPVFLAAIVALLTISSVRGVAAQQTDQTTYDNSLGQIALCELAGGTAEVDTYMTGAGFYAVTVMCHGGLLDGMVCINNPSGTACSLLLFNPELDDLVAPIDEAVDVAPEPTKAPIVIDQPVDIDPVVDPGTDDSGSSDEALEPTPEPTAEPIVDGGEVVDVDEIAPPTEGTDDGGRDLPEINDTVEIDEIVATEPEKGSDDGGRVIDLKVNADIVAGDPVVAGP